MADNRLYIGNIKTGEFYCFTKGYGAEWNPIKERDFKGINEILKTDYCDSPELTLVLFSERDDELYYKFMRGNFEDF